MNITYWCSVCSGEPAVDQVEVEWPVDGEWITLPVGEQCLTRAQEEGKLET